MFRKRFVLQYHTTEKIVRGPYSYFWKSLVYLKVTGAAHLSGAKVLVNHRRWHNKMSKSFRLQKVRERALLVLLKASGIEKLCVTLFRRESLLFFSKTAGVEKFYQGYHEFPSKIFCLTVPKTFIEGTF